MKVCITVIVVCLSKFHIWEMSGFWDMVQNVLGQSGSQDFWINCRTLKLAVSHKEVNEINWFLVCPSNSFLRNGSLGFPDFWHNGRKLEYWNTDRVLFPGNSFLARICSKRTQNGSKRCFFWFFEKFFLACPEYPK